jgi:hypothetical protein
MIWKQPSSTLVRFTVAAAIVAIAGVAQAQKPVFRPQRSAHPYRYRGHAYYASPDCEKALLKVAGGDTTNEIMATALSCADHLDHARLQLYTLLAGDEERRNGKLVMDIPEYHDEQRLPADVAPQLGPSAVIYTSPFLSGFTDRSQIQAHAYPGVLAGYVIVIPDKTATGALPPVPNSYAALQLDWGVNCVFLEAPPGTPTGYVAHVFRPPSLTGTDLQQACRDDRGNANGDEGLASLKVINMPLPTNPATSAPFTASDMVSAARFQEDTHGRAVFGLPCLTEWCAIGIDDGNFTGVANSFCTWAGVTCTTRESLIYSWYDEQQFDSKATGHWESTTLRVAIVPKPGIDALLVGDFLNTPREMATIYLSGEPATGSKLWKHGFRQGANRVTLMEDNAQNWSFHVTPAAGLLPGQPNKDMAADRMTHVDVRVPGSVRFRFTEFDAGIWAPCGEACCNSNGR